MEKKFEMYIKVTLIIVFISLFLGVLLKNSVLIMGISFSLLISIICNYLLYYSTIKIVYENQNIFIFLVYFCMRFILYFLTLLLIYYIFNKYNLRYIRITLLLSCISFLSMKIYIYLEKLLNMKGGNDENKRK